ncbi:MAG: four helix bundle protein [bacterium]
MNENYKNLIVWQKSIDLVIAVYELLKDFPEDERYGLISQTRRAAVSISANIAEGRMRGGEVEFKRFLLIAFASGAEIETHLTIAKRLKYGNIEKYENVENLLTEILKILRVLIKNTSK